MKHFMKKFTKFARQFSLFALVCFFSLSPLVSFAQGTGGNSGGGTGGNSGGTVTLENPLAGGITSLQDFLVAILNNIILPICAIVVVMLIIYSGFLFVTARGDVDQLKDAKQSLKNVVIGTAILFGAVAISYAIGNTLCQIAPNLPRCPDIMRLPQQ